MIKPEELRIGDYVRVSSDNCMIPKGAVCKVVAIDALINLIVVQKSDVDVRRCLVKEEIEGIPLTPEILEKNGWDKGQVYFTHSRIPRIKLCTDENESKWSVSINGDIMGGYIFYVHQLQHILWTFVEDANLKI